MEVIMGKRLDQLERFWQSQLMNQPSDVFDQLFIESFPYYLGIAENAIQYVVDTEIDDTPQLADAATICQERFTPLLWQQTNKLKIPIDWVYDHQVEIWQNGFAIYRWKRRKVGKKQFFSL